MAGGNSVFRAGCAHANHFHGAKIRRHEGDAADPGREGTAGKEEVRAGLHEALEEDANAQDEGEVKKHDDPINGRQIHFAILSTVKRVNHQDDHWVRVGCVGRDGSRVPDL